MDGGWSKLKTDIVPCLTKYKYIKHVNKCSISDRIIYYIMATLIIIMSISRDSRKTIAKIHVHKKKI